MSLAVFAGIVGAMKLVAPKFKHRIKEVRLSQQVHMAYYNGFEAGFRKGRGIR